MSQVKILINKLGAITNSEIELNKFLLFSGESGLGKSYTSFLAHYLYLLLIGSPRLNSIFTSRGWDYDELMSQKPSPGVLFEFSKDYLLAWLKKDAADYIRYMIGNPDSIIDVDFEISTLPENFQFYFDEELLGIKNSETYFVKLSLGTWVYRLPENSMKWGSQPFVSLLAAELQKHILGLEDSRINCTFLMPPSRGAIMGVKSNYTERIIASSGMYQEYADDLDMLYAPDSKMTSIEIDKRFREINGGDITLEDNKWVCKLGVDTIPLVAAASSVRELAPLSVFVRKYSLSESAVMFEEPEAHLHPTKQIVIADIIASMVMSGAYLQVTTHSDYVVRRLNDLMNLFRLKQKSEDRYNEICKVLGFDTSVIINPDFVNAYILKRRDDGTVEIARQDIEKGIPYDSFVPTISSNIRNSFLLSQELDKWL